LSIARLVVPGKRAPYTNRYGENLQTPQETDGVQYDEELLEFGIRMTRPPWPAY